jgi:hypothetical protein
VIVEAADRLRGRRFPTLAEVVRRGLGITIVPDRYSSECRHWLCRATTRVSGPACLRCDRRGNIVATRAASDASDASARAHYLDDSDAPGSIWQPCTRLRPCGEFSLWWFESTRAHEKSLELSGFAPAQGMRVPSGRPWQHCGNIARTARPTLARMSITTAANEGRPRDSAKAQPSDSSSGPSTSGSAAPQPATAGPAKGPTRRPCQPRGAGLAASVRGH